jgi:hypothetical protein
VLSAAAEQHQQQQPQYAATARRVDVLNQTAMLAHAHRLQKSLKEQQQQQRRIAQGSARTRRISLNSRTVSVSDLRRRFETPSASITAATAATTAAMPAVAAPTTTSPSAAVNHVPIQFAGSAADPSVHVEVPAHVLDAVSSAPSYAVARPAYYVVPDVKRAAAAATTISPLSPSTKTLPGHWLSSHTTANAAAAVSGLNKTAAAAAAAPAPSIGSHAVCILYSNAELSSVGTDAAAYVAAYQRLHRLFDTKAVLVEELNDVHQASQCRRLCVLASRAGNHSLRHQPLVFFRNRATDVYSFVATANTVQAVDREQLFDVFFKKALPPPPVVAAAAAAAAAAVAGGRGGSL